MQVHTLLSIFFDRSSIFFDRGIGDPFSLISVSKKIYFSEGHIPNILRILGQLLCYLRILGQLLCYNFASEASKILVYIFGLW